MLASQGCGKRGKTKSSGNESNSGFGTWVNSVGDFSNAVILNHNIDSKSANRFLGWFTDVGFTIRNCLR